MGGVQSFLTDAQAQALRGAICAGWLRITLRQGFSRSMNMHLTPPAPDVQNTDTAASVRQRNAFGVKSWAITALAILAIGLFIWFLTSRASEGGVTAPPPAPPTVTVMVPGVQEVSEMVTANGSIAAKRDMPVGVQGEGGRIVAIPVEAGQFVRKGQVLAEIDSRVQRAQLQQLEASVRQAQADAHLGQVELDRAIKLVDRGFISRADIDRRTATRDGAAARVELAKAQVGELRERIAQLSIRAPEAGLILQRSVELGQVVSPSSQALFRIASGGQMELRARIAEQDLQQLAVGQEAHVTPVGSRKQFVGKVWLLEPVIDTTTRQGMAHILLPAAPEIRSGGFAKVEVGGARALRPLLPQSAIMADAQGNHVLIVNDQNIVERRDVGVGTISEAGVAITSGLTGQEKVVMLAGAFLHPGEKVTPKIGDASTISNSYRTN